MFLLVSVRHVRAHPGEHQHGVSIQISINLGKTFLRISRIRNIPLAWILANLCIFTSVHFPDFGLNLLNGFDFYFDLFWMAWHWKPTINRWLQKRSNKRHPFLFSKITKNYKKANAMSIQVKRRECWKFMTFIYTTSGVFFSIIFSRVFIGSKTSNEFQLAKQTDESIGSVPLLT